jgi:cytochrome c6
MKIAIVCIVAGALIIACGRQEASGSKAVVTGADIYKKYCLLCHGVDGKLGVNGAKDITVSQLTEAERIVLIAEGKNTMTPFKGVLTSEQIKAVAAYTLTLK